MPYASGRIKALIVDPAPRRLSGEARLPVEDAQMASKLDELIQVIHELLDAIKE